ncbi:hypothetical protein C1645_824693 [Glomus cerebriforme]|uniref:Uncharacterized protein n=1 Tax=Glomus cerebriforme TaxID=658196 RepID=A0A397T351_9GLOM|nr:hypothetical protein C1645_824693 [Glomus cerebriforme]
MATGKALARTCQEFYDAKINLERKFTMNSVIKESVNVTAQTKGLQTFLQSEIESSSSPSTPSPCSSETNSLPSIPLSPLTKTNNPHSLTTPQKWRFKDEQVQQYVNNLPLICAIDLSIEQLKLVVGMELAQLTMSIRSQNPPI